MSDRWKKEMARRRQNPESIEDKLRGYAEKFKADAMRSCAGLKGPALEKAKTDIEKAAQDIATGKTPVKLKDGELVAKPTRPRP